MWEIITLSAVIQGLTEFLPVSSSGHLRLIQHWFGLEEPQTFVDLCLHLGTLLAVVWYYRTSILGLLRSCLGIGGETEKRRLVMLLVIGTIPTGCIGIFLGDIFEAHLATVSWVGFWLLVTGAALWWTRGKEEGTRGLDELTVVDVLCIGVVQGFAVLRGISRSGSTIATGLGLGLKREAAAELSFLLSIPAILGAVVLKGADVWSGDVVLNVPLDLLAMGTLLSGVVGYFALRLLVALVNQGGLFKFAPYCWLLGGLALFNGF